MADLGNRANVTTAINLLLDDAQPNDAIQPSDHNGLLINILDTLANGLSVTLRTNPETGGQDIEFTAGDKLKFKDSGFVSSLLTATLTADRTLTFPDKTGTVAITSDIENILNTNGLILGGNYTHDLNSLSLAMFGGSVGIGDDLTVVSSDATKTNVGSFISSNSNPVLIVGNINESVAIGANGADGSAKLEIESTTKGFLIPRMVTTQRNAISLPAESLLIYNTTTDQFEFRSSAGTWDALGGDDSIYTADGTLLGNRIVDLNSNQLSFDGATGSLIIMKDDGTLELGLGSNAGSKFEVAVGNLANASGATSIAVGYNSQSTTDFTIAIGRNANATHTRTTIIGAQSSSGGEGATSLGYGVGVGANGTSIGYISDAGTNAVALGNVAQATGSSSIAIGSKATASGSKSIMISNDGLAVTNNVANSLALSFDQSGHIFFAGLTANSYFNGSGNFGFGTTTPTAKLTVQGNGTSTGITLALYDNDTTPNKTWEWLDNGTMNGSDGARITNTIVNPSVQEAISSATFTINADQETTGVITAMASATTIASPTGTPVQGQKLTFRFKDDGTGRAITWNAIFRAIGVTLPTTTTANKTIYVGCLYNSTETYWDVIAVKEEA